jgi:hypothetical protein
MSKNVNNWGGARANSGRPTKTEEQELIEDLDGIIDRKEAIRLLYEQMKKGNTRAFTIYFDRRYGRLKGKDREELGEETKYQIEVIHQPQDEVFKKIVENIRFVSSEENA